MKFNSWNSTLLEWIFEGVKFWIVGENIMDLHKCPKMKSPVYFEIGTGIAINIGKTMHLFEWH